MKHKVKGLSKSKTGNSVADFEVVKRACRDCDSEGVIWNDFDESIECPKCCGKGYHLDTI